MTKVNFDKGNRIKQGDIIKDVRCTGNISIDNNKIKVDFIVFPLIIVLTQDCDLTWDFESRNGGLINQDKKLMSVMIAPLYNYEHFVLGEHLSDLSRQGTRFSSENKKKLKQNETPRYHFLEFDDTVPIVNSVIDFKHYFTVNVVELENQKSNDFICNISDLFREDISQRFSNYLARIGLPV